MPQRTACHFGSDVEMSHALAIIRPFTRSTCGFSSQPSHLGHFRVRTMATPSIVSDFNVASSSRQQPQPTTAHTPVIVELDDDVKDEGLTSSRRKQIRMAMGACIMLVALIVGCAVGFTSGSSNADAAQSSETISVYHAT